MTEDHLTAIIKAAQAKKDDQGWWVTQEARHVTLYVSASGSSLTVSRIESLRLDGALVRAKSVRGEEYLLALEDIFAGAVEPQAQGGRRAGFG
jgi:hypothetical protein